MKKYSRAEIKANAKLNSLLKTFVKMYRPPKHTITVHLKNKHIKDFCEESEHFAITGSEYRYVSYTVSTWYQDALFPMRVDAITIYDSEKEYIQARQKANVPE